MSSLILLAKAQEHPALAAGKVDATWLQSILDASATAIRNWCNRNFDATAYAEVHDGNNMRIIYADQLPILELSSIDVFDNDGTVTIYSGANFAVNAETGKIRYSDDASLNPYGEIQFDQGFRNITLNYRAGYSSTIPDAVQQANVLLAYNVLRRTAAAVTPGMQSETLGEYSYQRQGTVDAGAPIITPDVQLLLYPYRRIPVG